MTPTSRRDRTTRGRFISKARRQSESAQRRSESARRRSESARRQFKENTGGQMQAVAPAQNSIDFGSLVTLRKWQIAVTPDRAQVCIGGFIMITQILSVLSIIAFWFFAIMCLRALPGWNGPTQLFNGIMRRRQAIVDALHIPADPNDNMWRDLFPEADRLASYTLRVSLRDSGQLGAAIITGTEIPLLTMNPLVWLVLMALTFGSYYFLSFIHGSLERAYRATSAIGRHHLP